MQITCNICQKTYNSLARHLKNHHPEISVCKYKKQFNIAVNPVDTMLDKLQCSSKQELADILGTTRTGLIYKVRKGTAHLNILRPYAIIQILLNRMDEEQLQKVRRQIRFMADG